MYSGSHRWAEVSDAFSELATLPPAEQRARVAAIAGADPELATLVGDLIEADRHADERLGPMEAVFSQLVPKESIATLAANADVMRFTNRTVGHFRVREPIAVGGMGIVYRAEDLELGRPIALKFPLPQFHGDASVKERFLREAQSAGALDHPNVCSIYETGETADGHLFLAMPLYEGETLRELLAREGALPRPRLLDIARQLAAGLAAAHAIGIVHRDLKPGNVMLLPNGTVKILDFGLAKGRDLAQTASVMRLGTAMYMAPEQVRGEAVDARTDLWALGVVMYEMATGRRPFSGEHDLAIALAILHDTPASLPSLRPDLPRPIIRVILALLERRPKDRPAQAEDVWMDISTIVQGQVPSQRRNVLQRSWRHVTRPLQRSGRGRAAALMALVLVVAGAWAIRQSSGRTRRTLAQPTRSEPAYTMYLRGRYYQDRPVTEASLRIAEVSYRRALALDPGFALCRAALSSVHMNWYISGLDHTQARLAQSGREAATAVRLQPLLPEASVALADYYAESHQFRKGVAHLRTARHRMPASARLATSLAVALRGVGRWDDALATLDSAQRIDPDDQSAWTQLAFTYTDLRRYPEAVANWDRVIAPTSSAGPSLLRAAVFLRSQGSTDTLEAVLRRLPPFSDVTGMRMGAEVLLARTQSRPARGIAALETSDAPVHYGTMVWHPRTLLRAQLYAEAGRMREAAAYFDSARMVIEPKVAAAPMEPRMHLALGLALAGLGRNEDAIREARRAGEIVQMADDFTFATAALAGSAEVLAAAGANHEAIQLLDRLLTLPVGRDVSVPFLRIDPAYAGLRKDPRFEAMLERHLH